VAERTAALYQDLVSAHADATLAVPISAIPG